MKKGQRSSSNCREERGSVTAERGQGITSITFSHPKANSFPLQLLHELASSIETAANDAECKVIVLQSAGEGAFSAGASFAEFQNIKTELEAKNFFAGFAAVLLAIVRSPKFVICRVQGKAVGGGVGIIAACDYVIAHAAAEVRLSELELGIGPFVIAAALNRRVGQTAFQTMTIDGEWRSSEWCHKHGLFSTVVEERETLNETVQALAIKLAAAPAEATLRLKQLFGADTEDWEALLSARASVCGKLLISRGGK